MKLCEVGYMYSRIAKFCDSDNSAGCRTIKQVSFASCVFTWENRYDGQITLTKNYTFQQDKEAFICKEANYAGYLDNNVTKHNSSPHFVV